MNNNELNEEVKRMEKAARLLMVLSAVMLVGFIVLFCGTKAHAEEINYNRYANAIYKIEGGSKTRHPYGVLGIWHKSPRIICINTLKHTYRKWLVSGKKVPYNTFLDHIYAPIGCNNDIGTNKNWLHNLNWYLMKGGI